MQSQLSAVRTGGGLEVVSEVGLAIGAGVAARRARCSRTVGHWLRLGALLSVSLERAMGIEPT